MELTKKELLRLDELEILAKDNFIESQEYRVDDWLDEASAKEWRILFNKFIK